MNATRYSLSLSLSLSLLQERAALSLFLIIHHHRLIRHPRNNATVRVVLNGSQVVATRGEGEAKSARKERVCVCSAHLLSIVEIETETRPFTAAPCTKALAHKQATKL